MLLIDTTFKLLGLSETLHRWQGALGALKVRKRRRLAAYADEIAGCLARMAQAYRALLEAPGDTSAQAAAHASIVREIGRLKGYVEDVAVTLQDQLDGRKIAGVKKRLEGLVVTGAGGEVAPPARRADVDRLLEAEGYMRALADRFRT